MNLSDAERRRLVGLIPEATEVFDRRWRQQRTALRYQPPTFDLSRETAAVAEASKKPLSDLLDAQLEHLDRLRATWTDDLERALRKAWQAALPPNLRPIADQTSPGIILNFVEEEGIPLYLVPRPSIAEQLLSAEDTALRRRLLSENSDLIVADCASVLADCDASFTESAVRFMDLVMAALTDDHNAAGQALATNLLDTLLQTSMEEADRITMTSHREGRGPHALDLELRQSYVMLPIWKAYSKFRPSDDDAVPDVYSRHASVHGVSEMQYTRVNALQALMLVTSYIGLLNGL